MDKFPEFSIVRLTRPVTVTDGDQVFDFPQGTEGTIVDVLPGADAAYYVEFMPRAPRYDQSDNLIENGVFALDVVQHQDLELVWQPPAA